MASATAILKVGMDGSITPVVERPEIKDCDANPPPDGLPGFQGLALSTDGTVFAAATGCRTVVKILPQGIVETVVKSERPWSPTAVAIHEQDLYILEWTNPNGGPEAGWRPRVRTISHDGTVKVLITIAENVKVNRRP